MAKTDVSLAVIISHPIQYWVPVYRALAEMDGIRVKVFFVAENGAYEYFDAQFGQTIKWDIPLTEGYEHEFLSPGRVLSDYGFWSVDATKVIERVASFAPDYIWINGYAQRINWRVLRAFSKSAGFIYNSDSNLDDVRSSWKVRLKSLLLRYFFNKMDVCISCSPKNRQYLEHYGVEPDSIVDSVFPVDTVRLYQQQERVSDHDVKELRVELDVPPEDRLLLFAGKLIDHKRPQDIIEAVGRLRRNGHTVSAIIVGSGELLSELESLAASLDVSSAVKFVGFINQSQLGKYFAASDLFVFPSSKEPFGVIASEVLAFGLPIVAADNIGAVGASILPGVNALLYPCGDINELTNQLSILLSDKDLCQSLSTGSANLAVQFDKGVLANHIFSICNRKKVKN